MIRLLLVDDHPVMRAGMANVLNMDPDFKVVAQADDGETALTLLWSPWVGIH
jgi:DNA-binding NarL/FixJ family response regulator